MRIFLSSSFAIFFLIFLISASAETSLNISWSLTDSIIMPGGITTVMLTLTNPSSSEDIGYIEIFVTPGSYLKTSMAYQKMDILSRSSSQQTSFSVTVDSAAVSMDSYVNVRASYNTGTKKDATVSIPVAIRRAPSLQLSNISYDKDIVGPGNIVQLSFDIVNNGGGAAKDIKIILNQSGEKFVVLSSEEQFINSLDAGRKANIAYDLTVSPNIAIGTYSIPVKLSYYDELKNTTYTDTKNIGLVVSGKYNFIIVPETQKVVAPGKRGTVSLQIANAGNQEALYLVSKILPSDPLIQAEPAEVYIGNLKSDNYDIRDFEFKVSDSAKPGEYPLNIQLQYKDMYDQSHTETYHASIKVSSLSEYSESTKDGMPVYTKIILIAGVIAVAIFFYKRHKKKK